MERRLGRGMAEILEASTQAAEQVVMLGVNNIRPCRFQPREKIDEGELAQLKQSIKARGLIQPIVVRPVAHGIYELVAGERRWRAAQAIGLQQVPAIVKALDDKQTVECSLIENLQRSGLNPLEEAKGYTRLVEQFGYTQEQVAGVVGKDRASISNALRLLRLPKDIQEALREDRLSAGHAKVLLAMDQPERQLDLFRKTLAEHLSVRALEAIGGQWQPRSRRKRKAVDPQLRAVEQELQQHLGTKVLVSSRRRGGRIIIEYFSTEDLDRILGLLGASRKT